MENLFDNNDEDSLALASKTWNRVINSASTTGFKEGIEDGSQSVFQESFDRGYKTAFKTTFLIGVYKGLANCLIKDLKHPEEIEHLLTKTKKGVCYLCDMELKDSNALEKSIIEIESHQQQHSSEILKTLQNYFIPLFKKYNVDMEFINFYT